jgi:hypothetical protein
MFKSLKKLISTDNKLIFWNAQLFRQALKTSLNTKEILLCDMSLNNTNNSRFIKLNLFFRYRKIKIYINKSNNLKLVKKRQLFNIAILLKSFQKIKHNFNNCLIFNLNRIVKACVVRVFLKDFKKFKHNLFIRRNDLFSDFINLSPLIMIKSINVNTYLLLLAQIFSLLLKKKHSSFFFFKYFIYKINY